MENLSKEAIITVFAEYNSLWKLIQQQLEYSSKNPSCIMDFTEDLEHILRRVNGGYGDIYENCDYVSFFCFVDHDKKKPGEVAEIQFMVTQEKNEKGDIVKYKLSNTMTVYVVGEDVDNDYDEYEIDYKNILDEVSHKNWLVEALRKVRG